VSKNWAWLWVFAEFIPALIWGFSDKYTPGKALLRYNGLDPVLDDDISKSLYDSISDGSDGLSVKIKDRSVRNFLDKRYLLREIFMTIEPGHMVLLLGGSGSGKTTFINAVTGYEKANAEIILGGMNVYDEYDKMKYSIGFVPQLDLIRSNDTVFLTLYDAALLRMLQEYEPELIIYPLELVTFDEFLEEPGGDARKEAAELLRIAEPLFRKFDCDAALKAFSPAQLPVFYMLDDNAQTLREIRHSKENSHELFSSMLEAFEEEIGTARAAFFLNWRNPLIKRLANLRDAERVRVCLEILYVQALLTGRFPMQGNEMALLNDNLIQLIEWGTAQ
jgi:hypothetical protein